MFVVSAPSLWYFVTAAPVTGTVTKRRHDSRPCLLATVSSGARPNEPGPREWMGSEATREDFQGGGCEIFVQGLDRWVEFVCVESREEDRASVKGNSLSLALCPLRT